MEEKVDYYSLKVTKEYENARLDLYISLNLEDFSRSLIKKVIEANKVFVNGEVCFKCGYKVKENDLILFPKHYIENKKDYLNEFAPSFFDLNILYEDSDYLVIDKPCGISVHPNSNEKKDTIVNKLIYRYKNLPNNINAFRPGIVHRIDKDTSGLLIIAKNSKSLWWLSKMFAERLVDKVYISVGLNFSNIRLQDNFIIEGYIGRSLKNRKVFVLKNNKFSEKFRFSISYFYNYLQTSIFNTKLNLFIVVPKTGRTHQIRVHQKSIGVPILSDRLYLNQKQLNLSKEILGFKRISRKGIFLHSYLISFKNYDGKQYTFKSSIPEDFLILFDNFIIQSNLDKFINENKLLN